MNTLEGILVPSSNRGQYALEELDGPELTSGQTCEVLIGGHWIAGRIEHAGDIYASEDYSTVQRAKTVTTSSQMTAMCAGSVRT